MTSLVVRKIVMENVNDISRCKEDERARNLRKDILALVQNQIDPLDAMPGRVIAISATYNSLVILVLQIISGVAPRLTEDEAHEIRRSLGSSNTGSTWESNRTNSFSHSWH